MNINLVEFDNSALSILNTLVEDFPRPVQIGFADLFPEEQLDAKKRESHIGVIAFLRHENYIAHETGSASSFILTSAGLALFGRDINNHLRVKLNE